MQPNEKTLATRRAYYAKNREHILEQERVRRLNNRDQLNAAKRARRARNKDRYAPARKSEVNRYYRKYRERILASRIRYRNENKDKIAAQRRRKRYALSEAQYDTLLAKAAGTCMLCRQPTKSFCVDHAHTTGDVRGLLCSKCNLGLGLFNDSIEKLSLAIDYLKAYQQEKETK